MLARSGPHPTLVYICNPNNADGHTRPQDLEAFVRKLPATTRVVVDEAYPTRHASRQTLQTVPAPLRILRM